MKPSRQDVAQYRNRAHCHSVECLRQVCSVISCVIIFRCSAQARSQRWDGDAGKAQCLFQRCARTFTLGILSPGILEGAGPGSHTGFGWRSGLFMETLFIRFFKQILYFYTGSYHKMCFALCHDEVYV